jgi:coproporphyrinogen III oxidase-like Fe-S oxidoreductase
VITERALSKVVERESNRLLKLQPAKLKQLPAPATSKHHMLYVHIPFCERLCPFCSFNRFTFKETLSSKYFDSLKTEMKRVADRGYDFNTIYIGGGTPTVDIRALTDVIDLAKSLFSIKEVSCETNPNHLYPQWLEPLAGRVDRMSVGVQSFDDELLKRMDRFDKYGSGEQILDRLQASRGSFTALNVDMMFNYPTQTKEILVKDCERVLESGCTQVSFYPLMASPSVAKKLQSTVGEVSYTREADYYRIIREKLGSGFEQSSVWTFTRNGSAMIDEYIVADDDYVGIGSGAMSLIGDQLLVNSFSLREYSDRIARGLTSVTQAKRFSRHDLMRYRLLMGLFGGNFSGSAFKAQFGSSPGRLLPLEIGLLRGIGAVRKTPDAGYELTQRGNPLWVAAMRQFFIGVNNLRDQARAILPSDEQALLFGSGDSPECAKLGTL